MFKKPYAMLALAFALLLLSVTPVNASPSLSLGSAASYGLGGKLQASQSCTATPIVYASQACLGISSVSVSNAFVAILDDGVCSPSGDPACRFSPAFVSITQGGSVTWTTNSSLFHSVKSNNTANVGLTSFSGNITGKGAFSVTLFVPGAYQYYDSNYNWMRGTILVSPAPASPVLPPMPTTVQVDLSGTVGWNVEGLSSSETNLLVSQNVALSISPFPLVTFTPLTESGSFEQSINLSTRVETPGTATSIARSLLASLLTASAVSSLATGASGPVSQTILASQGSGPDYTEWWVNGPLSNGSPVQILRGWSSVTGSENLNLGGSIGTRTAWIVTSQLSQTFNLNIPNMNNPLGPASTANAAANLNLLWSFDKSSDILLRSNNTLSLTMHSVTPTEVFSPTGSVSVTVTRDMTLTLNLTMLLSSTNVSMPKPHATSNLMDILASIPWMPLGIAGLATGAAAAALVFWLTRRTRGRSLPEPVQTPAPPAPPSSS